MSWQFLRLLLIDIRVLLNRAIELPQTLDRLMDYNEQFAYHN